MEGVGQWVVGSYKREAERYYTGSGKYVGKDNELNCRLSFYGIATTGTKGARCEERHMQHM